MEAADVLKGAVKTKNGGYGDAAALLPPSVTRLKLSDERGEGKKKKGERQPPRWTDNMQQSDNTYPFSYLAVHPPNNEDITHRTDLRSHTKAISLSPSRQHAVRARFRF